MTDEERKAIFIIKKYLKALNNPNWTDEYVMENYSLAVQQLIENSKVINNVKGCVGVKSQTQGSRSVTFSDNLEAWIITEDVKMLLPNPCNFIAW